MPTQIALGSPLARKVFGAAVFGELVKKPGFVKNFTGPAPQAGEALTKLGQMQTSPKMPFVRIQSLEKGMGDTVSVDLFNIIQGKPIMGDEILEGKMMDLSYSSLDIKLNQFRGGVNTGGQMSQQRTIHKLRDFGRANLTGWALRLISQQALVHLAGDRGDEDTPQWVIPTRSDADFTKIMVNTVTAPSFDRHFYGGDATSIDTLDTSDIITLATIDRIRAEIDEQDFPLQPVVFPDDEAGEEDPLFVVLVTNRQWHHLVTRTGVNAIRTYQQNAAARGSKNPVFRGDPFLWNGMLVKKYPNPIRFYMGTDVTVALNQDTYATTTSTVPSFGTDVKLGDYAVDRAMVLGAQALGICYGKDSASGTHFSWYEQMTDHDNQYEASVRTIMGVEKLRWADASGRVNDHGVMVIDSYAPAPHIVVS